MPKCTVLSPEGAPNLREKESASAAVVGHDRNRRPECFRRRLERRFLLRRETCAQEQHFETGSLGAQQRQRLLGAVQHRGHPAFLAAEQALHDGHYLGVGAHGEDARHGRLGLNGRRKLGQQRVEFGTELGVDQAVFRVKRFIESGQGHVPGDQGAVAREAVHRRLQHG